MKKIFVYFMLLSIITVSCFGCSSAQEYDSIKLSEEKKKALRNTETDRVIEIFSSVGLFEFSEGKDINSMVASDKNSKYLVVSAFSISAVYKRKSADGDEYISDNEKKALLDYHEFYKYAVNPKTVFGIFNHTYNVYCLDGSDTYIFYYETAKGDYILYACPRESKTLYLFPKDKFYEVAYAACETFYGNNYHTQDGSYLSIFYANEYDLTPYVFEHTVS